MMQKRLRHAFIAILIFLSGFVVQPLSYAAKTRPVYNMPDSLLKQIRLETEQRSRGECEQRKELDSTKFYALNNQLFVLLGLADYFCHSSSFMPITIDKQGHWQAGAVIETQPMELFSDANGQLWMLSYFEHEAVVPYLHHSKDALHWQEISLPKSRQIECCFEYIKQLCLSGDKIGLKFTGIDENPVEYWQTAVANSLTASPSWQKLSLTPAADFQQCENKSLTAGSWQRTLSKNGRQVNFQSPNSAFQVRLPRWLK
jgi:hypothetical protein